MNKILIYLFTFAVCGQLHAQNLDDITRRTTLQEKPPLAYPALSERDLFWEHRVWRVIDVREKMNLPFINPERPLFDIITEAAEQSKITLYSAETDDFSLPLQPEEVQQILFSRDTVEIWTDTETTTLQEITNEIYFEDIKRWRIKEVWYFDSNASVMRCRILGIAPLREVYDDWGNFKYEQPLFWVHYPSARSVFAREQVFNAGNQAARTSWEDLFEMRRFAGVAYKESDVLNRRLSDMYSGVDRLLEADKIDAKVFNFEQDVWSK